METAFPSPEGQQSHKDTERQKYVVDACSRLASQATQGKVHITEVLTLANSLLGSDGQNFELPEIEFVLLEFQGKNRLMYDETNRDIHFL